LGKQASIILALVVINAGWMVFDGARALIVGDYVTPKSGMHAGQLGPWTYIVKAAGIDPRSTIMKSIFVIYGSLYLLSALAFVLRIPGAWTAVLALAILGLWFLPFGTLINLLVITLLFLPGSRIQL